MDKFEQFQVNEPQASRDPFKKSTMEPKKNEQNGNPSENNDYEFDMKSRKNKTLAMKDTLKSEKEDLACQKTSINKTKKSKSRSVPKEVEEDNNNATTKKKRGIFGKTFHIFGDFFSDMKYLWKKEELVDCLDAHGNHVKRPKKKIPLKNHKSSEDPEFQTADIQAKENIYENAKLGINYGALFN